MNAHTTQPKGMAAIADVDPYSFYDAIRAEAPLVFRLRLKDWEEVCQSPDEPPPNLQCLLR